MLTPQVLEGVGAGLSLGQVGRNWGLHLPGRRLHSLERGNAQPGKCPELTGDPDGDT